MGEVQDLQMEVSKISNDLHVQALIAELTDLEMEFRKISETLHVQKHERKRLQQIKRQTQRRIAAQEEYLESHLEEARHTLAASGDEVPDLKAILEEFLNFFSQH